MWNFKQFEKNIALVDDSGTEITYGQMDRLCEDLVSAVGGRTLVFCICDNVVGGVLGYAAFLRGQIVPAMLSHDLDPVMFCSLYKTYEPKYIWAPKAYADRYSDCSVVYESYDYALFRTPFRHSYDIYSDLALLLTTSGSTGSPKFVRQSYKNISANTKSIVAYLGLDENERPITTLPLQYTYGISILNTHFAVGATVLLTNKAIFQKDFWDFFREQKATSFGGVPYTYEMLKRLRFMRMDLPSLKTMTQAGGKLSPALHKEFSLYAEKTGRQFVVMYGQCEATARMSYLPPQDNLRKNGSMGIAIPGGTFKLIDVNGGEILAPDTEGELVYYGDNVTLGYAQTKEDLSKGDENHGVLVTGDMAKMDEEGYFYIVGRKKRFLKVFGNRVNLDELERLIKMEFGHLDCACGGRDDHVMVYLTADALSDDIRKFLSQKTGLHLSAFSVNIVEAIPKNESGKIMYSKLSDIS